MKHAQHVHNTRITRAQHAHNTCTTHVWHVHNTLVLAQLMYMYTWQWTRAIRDFNIIDRNISLITGSCNALYHNLYNDNAHQNKILMKLHKPRTYDITAPLQYFIHLRVTSMYFVQSLCSLGFQTGHVIGVYLLGQSASEKHNQEKKSTNLCAPREFLTKCVHHVW